MTWCTQQTIRKCSLTTRKLFLKPKSIHFIFFSPFSFNHRPHFSTHHFPLLHLLPAPPANYPPWLTLFTCSQLRAAVCESECVWHCLRLLCITLWQHGVVVAEVSQRTRAETFLHLSWSSLPWFLFRLYLYLLRTFVEVVLPLLGVLHQLGISVLFQLLLVFQVGHLLRLVLNLSAQTEEKMLKIPRYIICVFRSNAFCSWWY